MFEKTNSCTYLCLFCLQVGELYPPSVTGEPVQSTSPLTPAMSKLINCRLLRACYRKLQCKRETLSENVYKQVHHTHEYYEQVPF